MLEIYNKEDMPLVSINIPTFNEERELPITFEAISKQTYPNLEIIVIDGDSTDNTKKIANDFGARVYNYGGKLFGARQVGARESNGEYILLLDADQILKQDDVIERAVKKIQDYDMLIFEEDSYKPKTYIQKNLANEKKAMHNESNYSNPLKSGLLPRFFRKDILRKTFENVPEKLQPVIGAHDHAVISFEASKISNKIGILDNAVSHIEIESVVDFCKHFYRFGKSNKQLSSTGEYTEIFQSNTNMRKNAASALKSDLVFVSLRSLSYRFGYYFG